LGEDQDGSEINPKARQRGGAAAFEVNIDREPNAAEVAR